MSGSELDVEPVQLTARNVGGIEETSVSLTPGMNVLIGRNATNRISLLRAIMGALGSDGVAFKTDADEGEVSLSIDGETYTRRLRREFLDDRGEVAGQLRDRQMGRDRLTEQRTHRRELERRHEQVVSEIDEREA